MDSLWMGTLDSIIKMHVVYLAQKSVFQFQEHIQFLRPSLMSQETNSKMIP